MRAIQLTYSEKFVEQENITADNILRMGDFPKDAKVEWVDDLALGRRFIISSSEYEDKPLEEILRGKSHSITNYTQTFSLPSANLGQIWTIRPIPQEIVFALSAAGVVKVHEFSREEQQKHFDDALKTTTKQ